VKKLNKEAILLSYANPDDAGLDLTAISKRIVRDEDGLISYIEYGTGLAVEIPQGYIGFLYPRSSITKKEIMLKNSVGVIDSGYRGEVMCRFYATSLDMDEKDSNWYPTSDYKVGERVCQLIIIEKPAVNVVESDMLSDTERGDGGFGSTGN